MNINIAPQILKDASKLLCRMIQSGHTLQDTKVRDSGNILEWHLSNGDIIEIFNHVDYSTGEPQTKSTTITVYCDDEEQSRIRYPNL